MWVIADRRTNKQIGVNGYPSYQAAVEQITEWQDRHSSGGRPDITRELLLNMEPREWHE